MSLVRLLRFNFYRLLEMFCLCQIKKNEIVLLFVFVQMSLAEFVHFFVYFLFEMVQVLQILEMNSIFLSHPILVTLEILLCLIQKEQRENERQVFEDYTKQDLFISLIHL